jgi:hypothetical protein
MLKERLERALDELAGIGKERDLLRQEMTEAGDKNVSATRVRDTLEREKAKLEAQVENLVASKQLLHKTMTGQLLSVKLQLDEANEQRQQLAADNRRLSGLQLDWQERFRTEQLRAKNLADELKLLKHSTKSK